MSFLFKLKSFLSKTWNILASIVVGIISILGFIFFVRNSARKSEEELKNEIDDLQKDNDKQDGKLEYISEKIEEVEEEKEGLLDELENKTVDDSKNLEDFFDKRGF